MKKLIITSFIACSLSAAGYAQGAEKYCELIVYRQFLKNFVAELHPGGDIKTRQTFIRNAQGEKVKFPSAIDAVNYMAQQGWVVVCAFTRHGNEEHFIITKRS